VDIQQKIEEVKTLFTQHESWEDRYKELIKVGRSLPVMDDQFKEEKFRIKGCQSQVWLYPEFKDGKVYFQADSDAMLVKGIIGILINVYNEATPDEILQNKPDFF
jgi:cysteine desulfuration protein SufE